MSKEDTITHTTITKGAIIPSTPHKISTHLKTAITLLVMAFLLLAPTTTTYAKKVKIQSNLYQHELQRRIKDPFLINIVKRATTGKAGYLGGVQRNTTNSRKDKSKSRYTSYDIETYQKRTRT